VSAPGGSDANLERVQSLALLDARNKAIETRLQRAATRRTRTYELSRDGEWVIVQRDIDGGGSGGNNGNNDNDDETAAAAAAGDDEAAARIASRFSVKSAADVRGEVRFDHALANVNHYLHLRPITHSVFLRSFVP
jgi:hypothetical protein